MFMAAKSQPVIGAIMPWVMGRIRPGLIFFAALAGYPYTGLRNHRSSEKQGQYLLRAMDGRVLRRGHDLAALLRFFDKKTLHIVD